MIYTRALLGSTVLVGNIDETSQGGDIERLKNMLAVDEATTHERG